MIIKKTIIFILAIFIYSQINAQDSIRDKIPVDTNTKLITYKNAINEKGNKNELYIRAIEWVNANYKNAADVTRRRDALNGEIEGLHRIQLSFKDKDGNNVKTGLVEYTFVLQFKDNKYRYNFSNFNLKDKSKYPVENWLDKTKQGYSPLWDEYLKIIDIEICKLIDNLKITMKGKKAINDEW
ncbi:MAG: DUF4468 domain-containing protein [Bacteroidales bacterium]